MRIMAVQHLSTGEDKSIRLSDGATISYKNGVVKSVKIIDSGILDALRGWYGTLKLTIETGDHRKYTAKFLEHDLPLANGEHVFLRLESVPGHNAIGRLLRKRTTEITDIYHQKAMPEMIKEDGSPILIRRAKPSRSRKAFSAISGP